MNKLLENIKFDEKGLIPAIVQDEISSEVLTLCYMNKEALEKTLKEGKIYVYRRSKQKLMLKGETSGCIQNVRKLYIDCEGNSLLFEVEQIKAACHEGYFSCYFREVDKDGNIRIIASRIFDPKDVYK
ncbi:MAG: phosphoribosyl-AMP cyclohydrolase [Omnitrophica bacterium RIFCSPLOWO2_12_FULL_45_13]|nr:MAG: phosphoribosyl-AMP cyclohydrolase [Omnitrophica bacterium RIFCSPLOWO2_12_FULL_45_13]